MNALPIDDDVAPALKYATQALKDFFVLSSDKRIALILEQNRTFALGDDSAMPDFYDENARIIVGPVEGTPLNILAANGKGEIQPLFKAFFADDGGFPLGTELTFDSADQHGNIIYTTWYTSNGGKGTDTYVVENEKIVTQTAFVVVA